MRTQIVVKLAISPFFSAYFFLTKKRAICSYWLLKFKINQIDFSLTKKNNKTRNKNNQKDCH